MTNIAGRKFYINSVLNFPFLSCRDTPLFFFRISNMALPSKNMLKNHPLDALFVSSTRQSPIPDEHDEILKGDTTPTRLLT